MAVAETPSLAERGRAGARKRWDNDARRRGTAPGQRIVRLDEIDPAVRAAILALIDADHAAKAAKADEAGR